jgi:hypothetical protein
MDDSSAFYVEIIATLKGAMLRALVCSVSIVIAALLVGMIFALSCDSGGDGKSTSSICNASCRKVQECDEAGFEDTYDDMSECVDQCKEYVDDEVPATCKDEYLEAADCAAHLTCNDWEDEYDGCETEMNAASECQDNNEAT